MKAEFLKAINGTVVVVDAKQEAVTAGGIVLPDSAEADRVLTGEVLKVSPFLLENGKLQDPPVNVGEIAVYPMHAGAGAVWVDEVTRLTYRLIKWNEILAINYEKSQ